ncbi:MAG: hypothetical protein RRY36_05730 [Bacteroidaceae bacterium]
MSYYCESTLFVHTHNFSWGQVTHSHPYLPNSPHSHTSAQYQTIESLTNLLFTLVATAFVSTLLRAITLCYAPHLRGLARHLIKYYSLRAPPYLSFANIGC